jgi:hypothetical protein
VFHHEVGWSTGSPEPVKGNVEVVAVEAKEPLAEECSHFLQCIRTGEKPRTDTEEGLAVVRVLCAVEEAVRESNAPCKPLVESTVPRNGSASRRMNESKTQEDAETNVPVVLSMANDGVMLPTIGSTSEQTGMSVQKEIPLIDLAAQRIRIQDSLNHRITKVLDSQQFILGPEVRELEDRLRTYTGAAHAVTCASGTDALMLALLALKAGRGDAVLVPALTFIATVEPVVLVGAIPVIVDVDPDTLTIRPDLMEAGIEAARNAGLRPVGVIAVDLYGQPADYDSLYAATREHKLWIIEDAAQSFGASVNGRHVGALADITTTSFFPSKPLGCYGDGGAVFTDDVNLSRLQPRYDLYVSTDKGWTRLTLFASA